MGQDPPHLSVGIAAVRPSLRFLAVAIVGWAGIRAATMGVLPGASVFKVEPSEAKVPPIVATEFPRVEPVQPASAVEPQALPQTSQFAYAQTAVRPVMIPVYYAAQVSAPRRAAPESSSTILPSPRPLFYSSQAALDEWPVSRLAAISAPQRLSTPRQSAPTSVVPPLPPKLDRWQLSTWALLRSQQAGIAGSRSLATDGQLGASQAGARLFYYLDRRIALSARTSSEVGRRGGEAALGVRVQPLLGVPLWLDAERRQAIGRYGGGRNAFAFFAESGLYDRPLPWSFRFDGYLQGGVVGLKSRDLFIDGGLSVTRPVRGRFSAGFGVWGGAQPHLYRVDAGPRVTMRVRHNVKVHVDWRQRLAGNARPGSGPAVTLSGDF
ncbi:MAG: hypothetical protein ACTHJK_04985 [Sphingomicrobium sp.]